MTAKVFVDTNVLVYMYDDEETHKQARAIDVLAREQSTGLVISSQVLGEFYVTVTRGLRRPLSAVDARAAVDQLRRWPTISVDTRLVIAAIETSQRSQLSYWDALIIEAAVAGGCDRLLTEDLAAGSTIRGIEIVNPFV